MMRIALAAIATNVLLVGPAMAADKETLQLKLVGKKATLNWPYSESQEKFEALLQELKGKQKLGEKPIWPPPPVIEQVLRITNTGKQKVTIYVEGDPNVATLTLKGPAVVTANPGYTTTAEFRNPKEVVLEPGKSHDIPLKWLGDGFRNGGQYLYPTAPGDYTLSATYLLSTADGGKGPLLKSDEVKFRVEEPKK